MALCDYIGDARGQNRIAVEYPHMSEQAEPAIGSPEHAQAMRDWEINMRLMPSRERDRRVEIAQTQPDVLGEAKGDKDADVGYQGPQTE